MLIPVDVLLVFLTASTALALAPGPDNIFVLTQSAVHGRMAGIVVTLGLMTGVVVHSALVAIGVAAIFLTSAAAFTALKLAGAGYLVYLAWKAFLAGTTKIDTGTAPARSVKKLYLTGVIMNITNPKVAIFFLAFLPQFADPARGSVTLQVFIFGGLFAANAFVIFGAVAWSAGFLGDWLMRSPRAQSVLNRVAGIVFLGLAVRLLLTER
jgi:threonine/homoserine/homoserine lactone efflux protein